MKLSQGGTILLVALISFKTQAALFYVASEGKNANSGTATSPWLTLDYALSNKVLRPGDTIQIAGGTYTNSASTRIDGTASLPITIKGSGQGITTIDFGRLTISNSFYAVSDITIDHNYVLCLGIGCRDVTFQGCEFRRGTAGVNMRPHNSLFPSHITVTNCTFHHPTGDGMVTVDGNNHTIVANMFSDSSGHDALRVFGNNHVIRGNQFVRIVTPSEPGFNTTSTTSMVIGTGNKVITVGKGLSFSQYDQIKIASATNLSNTMTGFVDSYSETTLMVNVDTLTGTGTADSWIVTLASVGNHADIIQTFENSYHETTTNLLFEQNYIVDCSSQWGNLENNTANDLIRDWVYRNNLFNRSRINLNCCLPNVRIYNNTFYDTAGNTIGIRAMYSKSLGVANNMQIFNNLFIRVDGISAGDGAYSFNALTTGCTADYNILTSRTDGAFASLPNRGGSNSINGGFPPEAIFLNPSNGDFRLASKSVARTAGTNLPIDVIAVDFMGVDRGRVTGIGAFGGPAPLPPSKLRVVQEVINGMDFRLR